MVRQILEGAGIASIVASSKMLTDGIRDARWAAALLTEEGLMHVPSIDLDNALNGQPPWSDFPFIVMTARGYSTQLRASHLEMLRNVTQVERPVHPATLVGMIRAAIRARRRQHEAQRYLDERELAEQAIHNMASSLEQKVRDRTQALALTAKRLSAEIAERIKAQAEREHMEGQLIHMARLNAMGTMASTLAHELNQPLTAVMNYVSGSKRLLLQSSSPPSREILEALDGAAANSHRAGEIVRHLREFVSSGQITRQPENLPLLIDEALQIGMVDGTAQRVTCTVKLDPQAHTVSVDRIQIQQVLTNLVRNAVEAMATVADRKLFVSTHGDGDFVKVCVLDSGPGIAPNFLSSLFSPFKTTKNSGLGIGLSISRTIMEAHQGSITGVNSPAGGALFCITLPLLLK